jgi:hypothetical protein
MQNKNTCCFSCAKCSQEYLHCHRHSDGPLKIARTGNKSGHRATKSIPRPVERWSIVPAVTTWQCLELHAALVVLFPVPNEPFALFHLLETAHITYPSVNFLDEFNRNKWTRLKKCFLTLPPTLTVSIISLEFFVRASNIRSKILWHSPHCCCDCGEEFKVVCKKICIFLYRHHPFSWVVQVVLCGVYFVVKIIITLPSGRVNTRFITLL